MTTNKYISSLIIILMINIGVCFSQIGNVLGDIDGDYFINVIDVVSIVNVILGVGENPDDNELWAADLNIDDVVNIQDIIICVNIILADFGNDGVVNLENQSEHSGIKIEVGESGIWQSTDSLGYFNLHFIPDGYWTLRVKYPFFEMIEITVASIGGHIQHDLDFQLTQQLIFWVEPDEITIPPGIEGWYSLPITGCVSNISSNPVDIAVSVGLPYFFNVQPLDHEWDHDYEYMGMDHFCYINYECFSSDSGFPTNIAYTIHPGDTLWTSENLSPVGPIDSNCLIPGLYAGYFLISDNYHYPEYFELWHFSEFIPGELFENLNPLNRSISLKDGLSIPVIITQPEN